MEERKIVGLDIDYSYSDSWLDEEYKDSFFSQETEEVADKEEGWLFWL